MDITLSSQEELVDKLQTRLGLEVYNGDAQDAKNISIALGIALDKLLLLRQEK